jgi:hypothetical protein
MIACVLYCSDSLQASKVGVYVAVGTGFSFMSYGPILLDSEAVIGLFFVFAIQTSPPYDFQPFHSPHVWVGGVASLPNWRLGAWAVDTPWTKSLPWLV